MRKLNNLFFIIVFICWLIFIIAGCSPIARVIELTANSDNRVDNLGAGTGLDDEYSITGKAEILTNISTIYIGGDLIHSAFWADLETAILNLTLNGTSFTGLQYDNNTTNMNQERVTEFHYKIHKMVSTTEGYLAPGIYRAQIQRYWGSDTLYDGGEITFTVSTE